MIRTTLALSVFLAIFVTLAPHASAGTFVPLTDVQGSRLETVYQNSGEQTLSGFLTGLFTAVISVAAIVAVLRLGYAGYLYMTSESWGSKGKAKEVMGDVALGLLLLLSCWLILNQINPDILKLDILNSLKSAQVSQPAPATGTGTGAAPANGGGAGSFLGDNSGTQNNPCVSGGIAGDC